MVDPFAPHPDFATEPDFADLSSLRKALALNAAHNARFFAYFCEIDEDDETPTQQSVASDADEPRA